MSDRITNISHGIVSMDMASDTEVGLTFNTKVGIDHENNRR
jgi:hypothetical protein